MWGKNFNSVFKENSNQQVRDPGPPGERTRMKGHRHPGACRGHGMFGGVSTSIGRDLGHREAGEEMAPPCTHRLELQ